MYTLYGSNGSGSASVEAALTIIGAPFTLVETARWDQKTAYDELLRINPLGQIPTLKLPDGSVLTESAAIHIHLADAHPQAGWLPREPSARAQAIRGLVFIAANCYPMITVLDYPERFCAGAEGDDAAQKRVRDATRTQLHRHWEIFADLFPARPYLNGESIGALDLYAATVSRWAGARAHLEKQCPQFHAALLRIEAQAQVAAVFARHWPAKK